MSVTQGNQSKNYHIYFKEIKDELPNNSDERMWIEMWIRFDTMVLNTDTGTKFLVMDHSIFGDKMEPCLVHSVPSGGVTISSHIKTGTLKELRADLVSLADILGASWTTIKGAG